MAPAVSNSVLYCGTPTEAEPWPQWPAIVTKVHNPTTVDLTIFQPGLTTLAVATSCIQGTAPGNWNFPPPEVPA